MLVPIICIVKNKEYSIKKLVYLVKYDDINIIDKININEISSYQLVLLNDKYEPHIYDDEDINVLDFSDNYNIYSGSYNINYKFLKISKIQLKLIIKNSNLIKCKRFWCKYAGFICIPALIECYSDNQYYYRGEINLLGEHNYSDIILSINYDEIIFYYLGFEKTFIFNNLEMNKNIVIGNNDKYNLEISMNYDVFIYLYDKDGKIFSNGELKYEKLRFIKFFTKYNKK